MVATMGLYSTVLAPRSPRSGLGGIATQQVLAAAFGTPRWIHPQDLGIVAEPDQAGHLHLGRGFRFRAILEQLPQVQHFASGFGKLSAPIFDRTFPQIRTIHCSTILELSGLFFTSRLPSKSRPAMDTGYSPVSGSRRKDSQHEITH